MIKFSKKIIVAVSALLPVVSFIATFKYNITYGASYSGGSYGGGGLKGLFYIVKDILDQLVTLLISFAVIFFLYGILKYITAGGDEEKRTKMKNLMIYGIIGLFVMISFWGIVNILINTFELDTSPYVDVPYFDGDGTSGSGGGSGSGLRSGTDTE